MAVEALRAADLAAAAGIEVEVIDLRSVRPLDEELVLRSVRKTGRLVIADTGWRSFGIGAEIAARAAESALPSLKAPVRRVTLPDVPTPCSPALEKIYYPAAEQVVAAIEDVMGLGTREAVRSEAKGAHEPSAREFRGPF
jgi:pyruvate dehydrogenase E1 component beta subunit